MVDRWFCRESAIYPNDRLMYELIKNIEIDKIHVFVSKRSRLIMPTFYWVTRAPRLLQVSSENLRHRFRGAAPLLGPLAPTLTAVLLRVKAESLQQTMTLTVSVASTIAVRVRISNSILNSSQFMSVSDAQVLSWSILNSSNNSWLIWPRNIEGKSFFIVITPSVYNFMCPAVVIAETQQHFVYKPYAIYVCITDHACTRIQVSGAHT